MPAVLANLNDLAERITRMSPEVFPTFLTQVLRDGLGATPATLFPDPDGERSDSLLALMVERNFAPSLDTMIQAFPVEAYAESWRTALDRYAQIHDRDMDGERENRDVGAFQELWEATLVHHNPRPMVRALIVAEAAQWKTGLELRMAVAEAVDQGVFRAAHDLADARGHYRPNPPQIKAQEAAYQTAVTLAQTMGQLADQQLGLSLPAEEKFLTDLPAAACLANDPVLAQSLLTVLPTFEAGPYYLKSFFEAAVRYGALDVLPPLLAQARQMAPAETVQTHPFGVDLTRQIKDLVRNGSASGIYRPHEKAIAYLQANFGGKNLQPMAPGQTIPHQPSRRRHP